MFIKQLLRSNLRTQMASVEGKDSPATLSLMELATEQAKMAFETLEVPVGCVIVEDGKVIASGRNRTNETRNATRHAEMEAIDFLLEEWQKNGLSESKLQKNVQDAIFMLHVNHV